MPHLFRTRDGIEWRPGQPMPLALADGSPIEGIWAGSAQSEKLKWWLNHPGFLLAQTREVAAVAVRSEETGRPRWGEAPPGARLFFVLEPPKTGKSGQSYRLAKMVTIACTSEQKLYFDDERFSLFGAFNADGSITIIPPLPPPHTPLDALKPGELFEDPVVAAYTDGLDQSLLAENLRLSAQQRLEKLSAALRMVEGLKNAKLRKR